MVKETKIILMTVLFLLVAGIWRGFSPVPQENLAVSSLQEVSQKNEGTVFLTIDYGGKVQEFEIELENDLTAFSLLQESNLEISYQDSEFGVFIEAIGNKRGGDEGKYWLYYVNNEAPSVAADKKIIRPGDKVEFRFEKPQF